MATKSYYETDFRLIWYKIYVNVWFYFEQDKLIDEIESWNCSMAESPRRSFHGRLGSS